MAGNQSRGLIQASITKGWDPRVIPARDQYPAQRIDNFDVDMGNLPGKFVGELPGGPVNAWPDGYSREGLKDDYGAAPTFASPDVSRENKPRRTTNANPFAGMEGAMSSGGKRP